MNICFSTDFLWEIHAQFIHENGNTNLRNKHCPSVLFSPVFGLWNRLYEVGILSKICSNYLVGELARTWPSVVLVLCFESVILFTSPRS